MFGLEKPGEMVVILQVVGGLHSEHQDSSIRLGLSSHLSTSAYFIYSSLLMHYFTLLYTNLDSGTTLQRVQGSINFEEDAPVSNHICCLQRYTTLMSQKTMD